MIKINIKLTDKQVKDWLSEMVIIIDTAEKEKDGVKKNQHILDYLDKKKIKYINRKLEFGDYSCYLPAREDFGIIKDIWFNDEISIERKANLEELGGNLVNRKEDGESGGRIRFEKEMMRAKFNEAKILLMVEQGSLKDIRNHNYKKGPQPKSYLNTLFSWNSKYDLDSNFIEDKNIAGEFIVGMLHHHIKGVILRKLFDRIIK